MQPTIFTGRALPCLINIMIQNCISRSPVFTLSGATVHQEAGISLPIGTARFNIKRSTFSYRA